MSIRHWTRALPTGETNELLKELALYHIRRISAETVRERLTSCITSNDFLGLCDFDPPYSQLTAYDAINVRQALAFFQKRRDLDVGINKRDAAVKKFFEADKLCFETNEIFRLRSRGLFSFSPRVESILYMAQRKIALILGDLPNLEDLKFRFGPGATTQVKKKNASSLRKLSTPFACSEDAVPCIGDVLSEMPSWVFTEDESLDSAVTVKDVPVEIHPGRLDFVPKSYKTDRSIVVEPMLNQMVQLGIGDYIAARLRMSGIDLRDQSRNKSLAREGSISGDLATLDLSSASDTVSKLLVLDLLPYDWFDFLSTYRTSVVEFDGMQLRQQMFSSMGNGFTFALESLIFYALSWASTESGLRDRVSVYGDDIIVPTSSYESLVEVLNAVGFIPNRSKSFATGPFRESCGGDYLRGIDIRPCYIKGPLSGQSCFVLHNFYVRRSEPEAAAIVLSWIPTHIQKWGPDGYGDGHLIGDKGLRPHGRSKGWSGYTFETYVASPRKDFTVLPGDRVYPFYSIYVGDNPFHVKAEWLAGVVAEDESVQYGRASASYDRRGRLGVPLPGADTYRLIKVYTLGSSR